MKTFVLVSCVLAVASAQYGAPAHYGIHVPKINEIGVPVDTPEVQQARASHLAALASASSRAGPYTGEGQYQGDQGQYDQRRYEDVRYHGPHAYPTTQGIAHVTQDGVPLDTPEVAAAKANHFGLFSEALSRSAQQGPQYGAHYRKRRGIYGYAYPQHIPVIGANGVPVDTPEVQHAKAAHFAAYAKAAGGYIAAPVYANAGFYGISHDGLPLDTPEVAAAKAAHYVAFNEAATRNGAGHAVYAGLYAGPLAYTHGAVVPVDTPEVQQAKAAHFAAHAAARAGHY